MDVIGHIDMGSSPVLRTALLNSLKEAQCVAVNLSAVKYIDSSGIASLVEGLREAQKAKKRIVLFGLTSAVRQVLQLTRLTTIFEITDTEDQALGA
jgi:anti-sigma B factor antagonist